MSKERLFFALWPDEALRETLKPEADAVCDAATDGRPVPIENLHITLRFMGSLAPDEWRSAEKAAARVRHRDIKLVLDRAGFWPHTRILWIGCGEVPDPLLGLVADLNTELGGEGFDLNGRPYRPHLTVARGVTEAGELPRVSSVTWQPDHFALVRSELGAEVPEYEVVGEWPLR